MTDLSEVLKGYFSFEWNKHDVYQSQLKKFYDSQETRITHIVSEKFQLKARLGFVWPTKDGRHDIAEYCDDMVLIKKSDKRCLYPMDFLGDCNYMYYGCYLTIAAFLGGYDPERLLLVHGLDDNSSNNFKYRPEIAKIFLGNRYRSLQGIEKEISKEVIIPQIKMKLV